MARRSGGGSRSSAFGRGRSPSPMASRRTAPPPPPAAQPKAMATQPAPTQVGQPMAAAPGGGLMAQVATTAAGVAIGHTVGHALTGALMGGGNHGEQAPVEQGSQPVAQQQQYQQPLAGQEPCKFELDQFLACAQSQSNDLSLCDGFNHVLRECKLRYGNQHQFQ